MNIYETDHEESINLDHVDYFKHNALEQTLYVRFAGGNSTLGLEMSWSEYNERFIKAINKE